VFALADVAPIPTTEAALNAAASPNERTRVPTERLLERLGSRLLVIMR
jgi:hypothetical protein